MTEAKKKRPVAKSAQQKREEQADALIDIARCIHMYAEGVRRGEYAHVDFNFNQTRPGVESYDLKAEEWKAFEPGLETYVTLDAKFIERGEA